MLENYHDIITVNELMDILFISRNTAYDLLRDGTLYGFKAGSTWRIPRIAVEDYIGYKKLQKNIKYRY